MKNSKAIVCELTINGSTIKAGTLIKATMDQILKDDFELFSKLFSGNEDTLEKNYRDLDVRLDRQKFHIPNYTRFAFQVNKESHMNCLLLTIQNDILGNDEARKIILANIKKFRTETNFQGWTKQCPEFIVKLQ
jgi:hypothetical protein